MNDNQSTTAPPRYHALDALRGFALLLGVFYHAAESFVSGHFTWAIVDQDPSAFLQFARHASHCFRMEVFFLLAGFFARLVILKRGPRSFSWNRFQRIFIPFVIGWLILYPLLVGIWIVGAQKSGNYQFIPIPEEARQLAAWKLWIGFFLNGGLVQSFSLTHLWFLHQLMVIYLLFGLTRSLWLKVDPEGGYLQRIDRLAARVLQSPVRILVLSVPTVGMLFLMPQWTVSTPMHSLVPELGPTVLYGFCFTVGWFLHRQVFLLPRLTRGWGWSMLFAAIALLATWGIERRVGIPGLTNASPVVRRLVYEVCYATAMWGFTFGFLGLFLHRINGESRFWRYLADSSYWVYLAHLPIIVALQVWVADWPVRWPIKYAVILMVALPSLYLSYHYLVRSTFIGQQLNGKRWPFRARPPWIPWIRNR